MDSFAILNSRKRAIIALVHSIFFLAIAAVQALVSHAAPFSLHGGSATSGILLLSIYTTVTTVLLILLAMSDCATEKWYFGLCAASAIFGLLRIWLGDSALHANVMRVVFLGSAVILGFAIVRYHSAGSIIAPSVEDRR